MRRSVYVREFGQEERDTMKKGLRSPDVFTDGDLEQRSSKVAVKSLDNYIAMTTPSVSDNYKIDSQQVE